MTIKKDEWKNGVVAYDNTFNMTGLRMLTASEYNVLFAVLGHMSEGELDEHGRLSAKMKFSDIQEMLGMSKIKVDRTIASLDKLLDIKVAIFMEDRFIRSNFFESFTIIESTDEFLISLTVEMSSKLGVRRKLELGEPVQYTLLDLRDLAKLRSVYSKEIYKILRQFRSTGKVTIGSAKLIEYLKINKEQYSDYKIIAKFIIPAVEANKAYFKDLKVNVKEGDTELPNVLFFTFKKGQVKDGGNEIIDEVVEMYTDEEMEELLEYIKNHS